jgi:hypothetical protein|tara:strand:+ start:213 stop:476 length:264 start_codon:yes stop_codon:yes gene_type:complete
MCIFQKYSHIFGEEKKGLHRFRIYDIAIIDVILTILAAIIISYYTKYKFFIILIILFILGIIMHYLFGVNTTINKKIYNIYNTYITS